ncbi:cytochrome P450 [Annulohypoxylon nitens]|nr:cytochrome P450 [Annulohypoxylon nitens]
MDVAERLLVYLSSVLTLYGLIVLTYRILFHPLRKYPGSTFARLTEAYGGLFALGKCLHIETYEDHLRYGPVVRQAPDRLIFNSATALQAIYQNEQVAKSYVYSAAQPDQYNVFTTASNRVLSEQSMRTFEETLHEQINIFLEKLSRSNGTSVNMTPTLRYLGLNIASLLGFGYDLALQTDDTHRYLADALTSGNYRVNIAMQFTLFARLKLGNIMKLFPNNLRNKLLGMIRTMYDLYAAFNSQLQKQNNEMKLSDIWTEGFFFFSAGGDTIAAALTAAFFYLSEHRECYQKLSNEIRSSFNSASEIRNGSCLTGCRYLRAFIEETLRMSHPIPGTLWREMAPSTQGQPLVIDGHLIPPGTQIGVNIYSLHHNEKYFPDPFKFLPERWLEGSKNASYGAFALFMIGPRSCSGKALAYLEISLVLAKVMWCFDFEMAPGKIGGRGVKIEESEFPGYDILSAQYGGPYLVFKSRDGVGSDFIAE